MTKPETRHHRLALQWEAVGARGVVAVTATALLSCTTPAETPTTTVATTSPLRVETLVSGLDTPWDLAWGPDGSIWMTERPGRVSRVDPGTGAVTLVGEVDVLERGESGLMGMAFHPDFGNQPYVYLAHSYGTDFDIRNRLVRVRYDGAALGPPETLIDDIPGRSNHDGSRLAMGPDDYLYMTMGDAGRTELAQDLASPSGKVLRVTLEGAPAPDNPFGSLVYSFGHRNPQGIVFHPSTGDPYVAEHGPSDNDEVSRLVIGGNFGWPDVHGFCDGDTSGEEAFCASNDVVEPLEAWTPTIGISGLDYYDGDLIPEWKGSLLATSLTGETLYRIELSADGRSAVGREALYQGDFGRLRDVLVGPDGNVYLATSNRDGRGSPAADDDRILRITR